METTQVKYIIVGAGLSGLITANQLLKNGERDFLILEGNHRIGGRVHTSDGIDLGATWFQAHHRNLSQLLAETTVTSFDQYSRGKSVLVYNSMAPAHYFESEQTDSPAQRIEGGSIALIHALTEAVGDKVILNTAVKTIEDNGRQIMVSTSDKTYSADKIVVTLPPKLAAQLTYSPSLPNHLVRTMNCTHTWMSNAIKVGITFSKPFWRAKGLSGTMLGQVGPVIELYDHCAKDESVFALMGFVNEGLRDVAAESRKETILAYLEKYLGEEVREYLTYTEKDWSNEPFTCSSELKSVYMSPQYGHADFREMYLDNKLLFSGTETSPVYGGYLDGAVHSGIYAAKKLLA